CPLHRCKFSCRHFIFGILITCCVVCNVVFAVRCPIRRRCNRLPCCTCCTTIHTFHCVVDCIRTCFFSSTIGNTHGMSDLLTRSHNALCLFGQIQSDVCW